MGIKEEIVIVVALSGIILIIIDLLINFSKWEFIDIGIGFPINIFLLNIFLGFLFILIGVILLSIPNEDFEYVWYRINNIVLLIGIIITLIGMVLFIGHRNEDKIAYLVKYVHYAYNVKGYNVTDLGYNNEMNARAEDGYAFAIGEDVAISEFVIEIIH